MSESLWSLMAIVVLAALCVQVVASLSPTVNLRILPVHKRFRVQWCTAHVRQVEIAGTVLVAVLAAAQLGISLQS